jgi:hypothetical protein
MARKVRIPLEERLPEGWGGPWNDYLVLHGGSLGESGRTQANYLDSLVQLAEFVGDAAPNLEDLKPRRWCLRFWRTRAVRSRRSCATEDFAPCSTRCRTRTKTARRCWSGSDGGHCAAEGH